MINTLSRGGLIGFTAMYLPFLIFSKRHKIIILFLLVSVIALAPFVFPKAFFERIEETFSPEKKYSVLGADITVDESTSARIESWQYAFEQWRYYPFLGRGIPGGGAISEVQFARTLKETGTVGIVVFLWLIIALYKMAMRSYDYPYLDDFSKGLSLGFLCALSGIFIMGFAAETFIIIRIMEPFWFLAAMVQAVPEVYGQTNDFAKEEKI
jgi:hypothetical protein